MADAEGGRSFGRRRPPSKQATRLMLISALGAIALGVALGSLFLPRLLEFEGRPLDPFYELEGHPEPLLENVTVVRATNASPFDKLGILLFEDSLQFEGPMLPGIPVGPVSTVDANGDGILNVGDYFLVEVMPDRAYVLLITLLADPGGGGVGRHSWVT